MHQRADLIQFWPTIQPANMLAFELVSIVELLGIINMLFKKKKINNEPVLKLRIRTTKGLRSKGATYRGVNTDSKRTLQLTEVLIILHLHT